MSNFYTNAMNLLKKALDEIGEGKSARLAKVAEIDPTVVWRWFKDKRSPSLKDFAKIMDLLDVSLSEPSIPVDEFVLVPKEDALAGAGASTQTTDNITGYYAFRKSFFERERISTNMLVLMTVIGDSMEPLIRDKDTILVDKSQKFMRDGDIFVTRLDNELMIKRVIKIPRGWRLCSINPERPEIDIQDEDEQFEVIGRVRWFGRVL